ncbi:MULTISPECIES: substrate-binding periplasmic protein [unclassified Agarivorans]|uniref:substrate-binding periplasmic protein n=1 Tax=unclassified Agarivorans TaxID=2636026 RepID=UPI0026E31016|nr:MULTISPECIES: transporter substrate-binding domain-containing protein [unclassified Agarivorans]MDO6687294.1 transporter substrate-binding domain-containing protein [Agarivorans sp. 3_MG-2023]MDO6716952.1 transporter substrate-binding domain-containing protein [Agarivorans sp. 2_MG-2023]MDO6765102.1 transporter substrate-binding domain-containing protein [Agarivorans sp. 1_MG-2023]
MFEQKVGIIVLDAVYKKLGLSIDVNSLPAKRAQSEASNGLLDGEVMRIWSYGERNSQLIRVPTPYYSLNTTAFYLTERDLAVATLSDLAQYKLVIVRGVKHTADVTASFSEVEQLRNTDKLLEFVSRGRADVALTNKMDGLIALERLKLNEQITSSAPLAVFPLYHYIHRREFHLVKKVDKVIQDMLKSGELAQVIEQAEQRVLSQ